MFYVNRYTVGSIKTNCYVVVDNDTGKGAIIDPGDSSRDLNDEIDIIGRKNIEYILLTHGHFDHINKSDEYRNLTGAKVVINENESDFTKDNSLNLSYLFLDRGMAPFEADILLKDGDVLNLGETEIRMMHTPGHTKGGSCYVIGDYIFSGDTLMKCSMGRTDLKTGNSMAIFESLNKLFDIYGDYNVLPGHGDPTTLDYERLNNPYIRKVEYDDLY